MVNLLHSLARESDLLPGIFQQHRERNTAYLMELTTDNLLMHFRREAGLTSCLEKMENCHWGWDGPMSDLRGQATGHWLSAAARIIHTTGDPALKVKADTIVSELKRCQVEHGDGWFFPIPEKNLMWLKRGKHSWAPQYVCHKCMLGLLEMNQFTGNETVWEVLMGAADWFDRFTQDISPELMDDMMDWEETGGMMELWADLYGITQDDKFLRMMRLYERRRIFEPLLRGEDVLTNMHANTTIPEVHGAARAYEVTGEERYRRIVECYWDMAVTKRGMYATGGQTCGEIWTPMQKQSARLSDKTQEHCTVYNMIRLADYLFRWTGDKQYADYIERNLWNGLLSQAHWQEDLNNEIDCDIPHRNWKTGLVAYYQPLAPGSVKRWASRTCSFWCCVDTMMQANTIFQDFSLYERNDCLYVVQYHGVKCKATWQGVPLEMTVDTLRRTDQNIRYRPIQREYPSRPEDWAVSVKVHLDTPVKGSIKIRKPWWIADDAGIMVNGAAVTIIEEDGYYLLNKTWHEDDIEITLPKTITTHALPDEENTVAFLDGPITLAGLCSEERTLLGDIRNPLSILKPADERRWQQWQPNWYTHGQPVNIRFQPLYTIGDERYTVYFPVCSKEFK